MRNTRLHILLAGTVTLSSNLSVFACTYTPPPSPKIALKASAAVFAGRVRDIKQVLLGKGREKRRVKEIQFQAVKFWRGISHKTVVVRTGFNTCSYPFQKGSKYLVYAYGGPSQGRKVLYTSICTRTKNLTKAQMDLAALGIGKVALTT